MQQEENDIKIKPQRKKKRNFLGYIYLFAFVFLVSLGTLSYFVNLYSPNIDVSIGNGNSLTLGEEELDNEVKKIDERLKWIQMEDDLPTVAIRETERNNQKRDDNYLSKRQKKERIENNENEEDNEYTKQANVQKKEIIDFRLNEKISLQKEKKETEPQISQMVTKVYLGRYSTLEEAIEMQTKISRENYDVEPFIKAEKDYYIVQLGSFSEKERAASLIIKLKNRGYTPKVIYQ